MSQRPHLLDGTHSPYNISFYAFGLGTIFGIGVTISTVFYHAENPIYLTGGIYLIVLALFHWLEYMAVALFNSKKCGLDAYLIPHSTAYSIATVVSLTEFVVTSYFFPGIKSVQIFQHIGLALIIFGQTLRSLALYHASSNFSHIIATSKQPTHRLVTTGVYRYLRHPSYVGFYYWAIGTQLWCYCNHHSLTLFPICHARSPMISFEFPFKITTYEEALLVQFFGDEYKQYKKQTWVGIPFIQSS
ncbi:Isoprenylcysteine carboxyl methyltransferase family-domain-containing protein [Paraphysoderma sedebokerense]|nr:Isoprenylcysteine carboxyl methyltransferase family-domain-containing protein [Paraphysoderma sedebokerense]